uniref:Ig-like domain-containing protein n=1 Tax=Sphaeramia orbicularis TaxID=375764 RepID=A0A673BRF5_9TELE
IITALKFVKIISLSNVLHLLLLGSISVNSIRPQEVEVSETEGKSVTLTCDTENSDSDINLHWYRQHSDLQPPHFILWKRAQNSPTQYIRDLYRGRFTSETPDQTTQLTIKDLTLADTALYYCALETQ